MKQPRNLLAIAFAVVGVLWCVVGAVGTRIDFFGVGASPLDDHNTLQWLFGIPAVIGIAIMISQFRAGRWVAGPVLIVVGFGLTALNDIQFERRSERLEQVHAETEAWVEGLPLPAGVIRLDMRERAASLSHARESTGSVALELGSRASQAERFAILDPVLRQTGATFVRGGCARSQTHFRYELDDGRLIELDLGDPRETTSSTEITISYARESGDRPNAAYIGRDEPPCLSP